MTTDLTIHISTTTSETVSTFQAVENVTSDNTNVKFNNILLACGGPGYCKVGSTLTCYNTSQWDCEDCSQAEGVMFIVIALVVAIIAFSGNNLIIWATFQIQKTERTPLNHIKLSLSINDLLMSVYILLVIFPNAIRTFADTGSEINLRKSQFSGTTYSIIGGALFVIIYSTSLTHLILMSMYRLIAITWPLWYRINARKYVGWGIAVAWIIGIVTSVIPAILPGTLNYTYMTASFVFFPFPVLYPTAQIYTTPVAILANIFFSPYAIQSVILLTTTIVVRKKLASAKKLSSNTATGKNSRKSLKKEWNVITTIAMMQAGFTITILPFIVTVWSLLTRKVSCKDVSVVLMWFTLLTLSNSFVNVVVYSVKDRGFQKILCNKWPHLKKIFHYENIGQIRPT